MNREFVEIELINPSPRTVDRFEKFKDAQYRVEIIKNKINEKLEDDGFIIGEPMTLFGIDVYKNNLWARAWEGWVPDKEYAFKGGNKALNEGFIEGVDEEQIEEEDVF